MPQNLANFAHRKALRQLLLAQRCCMSKPEKRAREAVLLSLAVTAVKQHPGATVALYMPHLGEASVLALADAASNPLCLPVVMGKQAPLRFSRWQSGDPLVKGHYGIPVPASESWISPDVLFIPCLGYTQQRLRLGYGGGYYDRTLAEFASAGNTVITFGVAWRQAECALHSHAHDIAMNQMLLA